MRKNRKIFCNKCGKKFVMNKDIVQEGIFNMEYMWGYFSKKDGEIHSFDLCEKCYDDMISQFIIPVDIRDSNEMI
ncbi:MAG: hypothetical protein E7270_11105 [Lachnospiraceae bacterium]|nr:hypothetical protein [Lachnospiraceae bacterium]MBQ4068602.1 hypothetical protein [Lachnospiraceae bacterium]